MTNAMSPTEIANILPYPGDDPRGLAQVIDALTQSDTDLMRLADGVGLTRTELTKVWTDSTQQMVDGDLRKLASGLTDLRPGLSQALAAVQQHSTSLIGYRSDIDGYRQRWAAAQTLTDPGEVTTAVNSCLPSNATRNNEQQIKDDYQQTLFAAYVSTEVCTDALRSPWQNMQTSFGAPAQSGSPRTLQQDYNSLDAIEKAYYLSLGQQFLKGNQGPFNINEAWSTLPVLAQQALIITQSATIGSTDGVPVIARDQANRINLQNAIEHPEDPFPPPAGSDGKTWAIHNVLLIDRQETLKALQARLDDSTNPPPSYLISLDPNGAGRYVVSQGNPDTADNVAISVPGTGSNLEILDLLDRSHTMYVQAGASGAPNTAVITWMGYEAPPGFVTATTSGYAVDGAPALNSFANALRATHDGTPSLTTIIAHSYGTDVVALAASGDNTLNVDNIVFVASPGVGSEAASVNDLHLTGVPAEQMHQHIYATGSRGDPVADTAGIAWWNDPTNSSFGAHVFPSDPGRSVIYVSVPNHSGYW